MDILQQSLEAADILSPEAVDSELPDELMLELTQIDPVSSSEVYSSGTSTNGNVSNHVAGNNTQQRNPQIYQTNNNISTTQNILNQPSNRNLPIMNQSQIITTSLNNIQTVQNKMQVVNNVQQNLPKTQQVMLVPSTQAQQNGVYQIVNMPTQQQQQGARTMMPIKPMLLQQSNVNGRYTVSPISVNSNNINVVRASASNNQVISSCSSLTSYTSTNTMGQTVTTCSAVYSKIPSQIVTTTPSSGLFTTKLPPGIRVVQHLRPAKNDAQSQGGQNTNIVGTKVLTYPGNTAKVVTLNNANLQHQLSQQGVQLRQNQQTVTVVKPQLQQNNSKTQFVKLESKLPPRSTQVPIKGIQIASVNISLANDSSNYTNGVTTPSRNSPKVVLRHFPNKTQNVIPKVNLQNVSATQTVNSPKANVVVTQAPHQIVTPVNSRLVASPKLSSPTPQTPKVIPNNIQVFRVDASITEEQAEEVRNLIVSRTIVNKMRTLAHEQQQLVLAFQAQIRTMSLPVQQYYLRNPQLFVQKVLQVTSTGKPFMIQVKRNPSKSANNNTIKSTTGTPTTTTQQDKPALQHPTISLASQGEKRDVVTPQYIAKPVEVRQAVKRPASSANNSLSLILEQMECHKKIVLSPPNCNKPFNTTREALRRLLPYHICNIPNIDKKYFDESDALMENYCDKIKERIQRMYDKYHLLCLRDVTRKACSAEVVMVERIFLQQEKASFTKDKLKIAQDPNCVKNFFPKVKKETIKREFKVKEENTNEDKIIGSYNNDSDDHDQSDSESESNPPSSSNQSFQHHSPVTNNSDSSEQQDTLLQAAVDSIL